MIKVNTVESFSLTMKPLQDLIFITKIGSDDYSWSFLSGWVLEPGKLYKGKGWEITDSNRFSNSRSMNRHHSGGFVFLEEVHIAFPSDTKKTCRIYSLKDEGPETPISVYLEEIEPLDFDGSYVTLSRGQRSVLFQNEKFGVYDLCLPDGTLLYDLVARHDLTKVKIPVCFLFLHEHSTYLQRENPFIRPKW